MDLAPCHWRNQFSESHFVNGLKTAIVRGKVSNVTHFTVDNRYFENFVLPYSTANSHSMPRAVKFSQELVL